jgi:hypothetical protein
MRRDSTKKNKPSKSSGHAELLRPYEGKWVVLSADETRVLSSGLTLDEAVRKVRDICIEDTVITRVVPGNVCMIL